MMDKSCDENCNGCPIIFHKNSRMIRKIINEAYDKFGEDFQKIVQDNCPNLTCCYDCKVDDFCHTEGCNIYKEIKEVQNGQK
jgi:hypothetical protein